MDAEAPAEMTEEIQQKVRLGGSSLVEGRREGGSVWGGERVKQLAGGGQWCVTCGIWFHYSTCTLLFCEVSASSVLLLVLSLIY